MDTTFFIIISALLGYFVVKHFEMKKEIARHELDQQMNVVFESLDSIRRDIDKEVELLTDRINDLENEIYSEINKKFKSFSFAHNNLEKRVDSMDIELNKEIKEPSLYDNVPIP